MSRTWNGPASLPTKTGPEKIAAKTSLDTEDKGRDDNSASSSDLLHQLRLAVVDGPRHDARQRLNDAASQAATWTARGLIDRTAAVTVLSVAGQVAGIGQAEALAVVRAAFAGVSR